MCMLCSVTELTEVSTTSLELLVAKLDRLYPRFSTAGGGPITASPVKRLDGSYNKRHR